MKLKDERSKMCSEILNGIKVIKLYAWEIPMMETIEKIRKTELMCILKAGLVRNVVDVFNFSSPFLVSFTGLASGCQSFTRFCFRLRFAHSPRTH